MKGMYKPNIYIIHSTIFNVWFNVFYMFNNQYSKYPIIPLGTSCLPRLFYNTYNLIRIIYCTIFNVHILYIYTTCLLYLCTLRKKRRIIESKKYESSSWIENKIHIYNFQGWYKIHYVGSKHYIQHIRSDRFNKDMMHSAHIKTWYARGEENFLIYPI